MQIPHYLTACFVQLGLTTYRYRLNWKLFSFKFRELIDVVAEGEWSATSIIFSESGEKIFFDFATSYCDESEGEVDGPYSIKVPLNRVWIEDDYDELSTKNLSTSHSGMGWDFYTDVGLSTVSELTYSEYLNTWMGKDLKIRSQRVNGNGTIGGKNKFALKWATRMEWGGWALGAYGAYNVLESHAAGEINNRQLVIEQLSNAYSTFGGLNGAIWGVGWEMGHMIERTGPYQEWKDTYWYPWRYEHLGY